MIKRQYHYCCDLYGIAGEKWAYGYIEVGSWLPMDTRALHEHIKQRVSAAYPGCEICICNLSRVR